MVTVRAMLPGEEAAAASALADAFQRDAFAQWLWPDPSVRRELLDAMFPELLAARPEGSVVEVTDDLDAVAIWFPPGADRDITPPPGASDSVVGLFERLAAAAPPDDCWYLEFLGSRTLGAGKGSALLEHRPGPATLWTGAEVNLSFYAKNGFEVLSRHDATGASTWWLARS